jgi:hypothetical protein
MDLSDDLAARLMLWLCPPGQRQCLVLCPAGMLACL